MAVTLASLDNSEAKTAARRTVNYLTNRMTIEKLSAPSHGKDERITKIADDESNVIKISELLYALSYVTASVASTEPLVSSLADHLRDGMSENRGWTYFLTDGRMSPQLLPTAYAIRGLAAHGFDVQEPIQFLMHELEFSAGQQRQTDISVRVLCIFVLSFLPSRPENVQESKLRGWLARLWTQLEPLLGQDLEANIEYSDGDSHYYVRVPWQLYLICTASRLKPFRCFAAALAQRRLSSIVRAAGSEQGFFYPHSGDRVSTRTNGILYDVLCLIREEVRSKALLVDAVPGCRHRPSVLRFTTSEDSAHHRHSSNHRVVHLVLDSSTIRLVCRPGPWICRCSHAPSADGTQGYSVVAHFRDILYGEIEIPTYLMRFLRLPEFVRLRGVRLSNVDSIEFKDFNAPTRWEHGIGVACLALHYAECRPALPEAIKLEIFLAALLHDVATPPFAHTAEYVLKDFDHELETHNILSRTISPDSFPDLAVFQSELPGFYKACLDLARDRKVPLDPDEVARMVIGQGPLGYLISGTLDLDNADNVTRACLYMGIDVDRRLPLRLAEWLAGHDTPPVDLDKVSNPDVQLWRDYRRRLYSAFFESSSDELGRQAFLQHLMRRSIEAGVPRRQLVWNTDEGLLSRMSTVEESAEKGYAPLPDLVRRYRLIEQTQEVFSVPIRDEETLRVLRLPQAVSWIEKTLSGPYFEPLVMVAARRFSKELETLFPTSPVGALLAFKVGGPLEWKHLDDQIRSGLPSNLTPAQLRDALGRAIADKIPVWVRDRPWLARDPQEHARAAEVLNSVGDWSFYLSRNDSFHVYPSTFVHAIPASLINALGVKGELVLDPFGGTGQTAIEAIKYGGKAISADANSIATLIAKSRLTFLSAEDRAGLRSISAHDISMADCEDIPDFAFREKWFDADTLRELARIRSFITGWNDDISAQFMKACFSAILTSATGRKGEQHGFFADNTPLGSKLSSPPYRTAIEDFIRKLRRNIELLERLYSFLEKSDRDPAAELNRARALRQDAREATPKDYGIDPNSAAAIITSPPYLCTTDYSLGLRLSYYWLNPLGLDADFASEMGARRQRFSPERAIRNYLDDFALFGKRASALVRPGGYLAMVLGVSQAKAFEGKDVLGPVDKSLEASGFTIIWSRWRPIYWHRNHGYQRLRTERISVHALE